MTKKISSQRRHPFTHILNSDKSFSMANIKRTVDKKLVHRVNSLTERIDRVLKDGAPSSTSSDRRRMAVDLADLWHAGEELRKCLRELLTLRFPQDKSRFRNLLLLLDPLLIQHMEWHLKSLKRRRKALLRLLAET
jgi:hypothetical protein